MSYTPKEDIFHYKSYKTLPADKVVKYTKRGISSLIPSIYDPCGLIAPITLKGKLILQAAWTYQSRQGKLLDWDDPLPEDISRQWEKWINEIPEIANMQAERYLYKSKRVIPTKKDLYLHIFTDAGQKA